VKTIFFIFVFATQISSQITFYAHNEAFRGMGIEVIQDGKVYSDSWKLVGYDRSLERAEYENITFPVSGRGAVVKIRFRNYKNGIQEATFLLNNFSYSEHPLHVLISQENLAPALGSSFGPIREGLRMISRWNYPRDDIRINPGVKKVAGNAVRDYYKDLAARRLAERHIR